jgi:hypothetical protein
MTPIKAVNPWTWHDQFALSQAVDVADAARMLYCAGLNRTSELRTSN